MDSCQRHQTLAELAWVCPIPGFRSPRPRFFLDAVEKYQPADLISFGKEFFEAWDPAITMVAPLGKGPCICEGTRMQDYQGIPAQIAPKPLGLIKRLIGSTKEQIGCLPVTQPILQLRSKPHIEFGHRLSESGF